MFRVLLLVLGLLLPPMLLPGCLEASAFYHPRFQASPIPPGFEDVRFPTTDGLTLHGWFIPAVGRTPDAGPAPTVLHVHGNSGDIAAHLGNCRFLAAEGFNVFLFDYRGYGTSDRPRGTLRRDQMLADTEAALDFLAARNDVDHTRTAIFGYSLGAVLGLAAAADEPQVRAVVAFAGFSSWKGVAADHAGLLGRLLIGNGEDAADSVGRLGDRPLLVVHGTRDGIVPYRHAGLLLDAASRAGVRAELCTVEGANHLTLGGNPEVRGRVAGFLRRELDTE
ncbi:MAG: alpha/beta fold hydrolase [Phycisphaerales bacterium]|nr:alpha/beta fold hydrolase [Phycisphaerales bacterium]